jgi:phosphatidate phosphatase PAH1
VEKIIRDVEKLKVEKEHFQDLAKTAEVDAKKGEKKLVEENLKISRLEDKLEEYKDKIANKLVKTVQKLHQKDAEFASIKLENEKQIQKLLELLKKKQNQINELLSLKRFNSFFFQFIHV